MAKEVTARRRAGDEHEEQAVDFLTERGLVLLTKNHQCKFGEIDLIMNDGGTIVFVEVRYRKNRQFGGAAVSVTPAKQRKIALAALNYLQSTKGHDKPCRFDVLAFSGSDREWIQDAFHSPL